MLGMILLAALALFVAVIAVRTIRFTPKPQPAVSEETFELNEDAVIDALAKLVRCKTISYNDNSIHVVHSRAYKILFNYSMPLKLILPNQFYLLIE